MKEDISLERETILNLIAAISLKARDFIERVFENTFVLYAQNSKNGQGVFIKAASEDLLIYYAHFPDDSSPKILNIIRGEIDRTAATQAEMCFNVYGKNKRIIELVQSKGYTLDMAGYILQYSAPTPPGVDLGELEVGAFIPSMCGDFVALFEAAYEQLNLENGWDAKIYSKKAGHFCRRLSELHERQSMKSFWHQGVLMGCYIVDENYITDIVVHPRFQNKGYGSLMLKHGIRFMREKKGVHNICLRIAESNVNAKRFYERHGFCAVSHFAEHTYQGK